MRLPSSILPLIAAAATSCLAFVPPTGTRAPTSTSTSNDNILSTSRRQTGGSVLSVSAAPQSDVVGAPGTADLPWEDLGFEFRTTKSHLRMVYKDGKWGEAELVE
ncbi:hypothetical protein THAOC_27464, partial [Thalassiosira oceanica]